MMRKGLFIVLSSIIFLTSCSKPNLPEETRAPVPPALSADAAAVTTDEVPFARSAGSEVPQAMASASPGPQPDSADTPPVTPNPPPDDFLVPEDLSIPEITYEDAKYTNTPYLVKLEQYKEDAYTDGASTFVFKEDGTVLCSLTGEEYVMEKKEFGETQNIYRIMQTEEYTEICKKASEMLESDYEIPFKLAHKDDGTYYLYDNPMDGGSGGAYSLPDESVFVSISEDGEFLNFGNLKAAHVIYHNGYFYYVELAGRIYFTPGIGKIMRVDMDGKNVTDIIDEPVFGTIQIANGRLYYSGLADGKAYSTNLNGKDKTLVGDRIVPDHHRADLEFYGDTVISRFWQKPGYDYGVNVFPNDYAAPAIMDSNGYSLVTFPPELHGEDAYEVINWGKEDGVFGDNILILKSKNDGSYWVYSRGHGDRYVPDLYSMAWDEYLKLYP